MIVVSKCNAISLQKSTILVLINKLIISLYIYIYIITTYYNGPNVVRTLNVLAITNDQ